MSEFLIEKREKLERDIREVETLLESNKKIGNQKRIDILAKRLIELIYQYGRIEASINSLAEIQEGSPESRLDDSHLRLIADLIDMAQNILCIVPDTELRGLLDTKIEKVKDIADWYPKMMSRIEELMKAPEWKRHIEDAEKERKKEWEQWLANGAPHPHWDDNGVWIE